MIPPARRLLKLPLERDFSLLFGGGGRARLVLLEQRAEFHVFRHDDYFGMGLSLGARQALLFEPSHDSDAAPFLP